MRSKLRLKIRSLAVGLIKATILRVRLSLHRKCFFLVSVSQDHYTSAAGRTDINLSSASFFKV